MVNFRRSHTGAVENDELSLLPREEEAKRPDISDLTSPVAIEGEIIDPPPSLYPTASVDATRRISLSGNKDSPHKRAVPIFLKSFATKKRISNAITENSLAASYSDVCGRENRSSEECDDSENYHSPNVGTGNVTSRNKFLEEDDVEHEIHSPASAKLRSQLSGEEEEEKEKSGPRSAEATGVKSKRTWTLKIDKSVTDRIQYGKPKSRFFVDKQIGLTNPSSHENTDSDSQSTTNVGVTTLTVDF